METKPLNGFPYDVCFMGAGNMALAIATSIIKQGLSPSKIYASAPSKKRSETWKKLGATFTNNNAEVLRDDAIVFLAMKPQYLTNAVKDLPVKSPRCVVSMLVGVEIRTISKAIEHALSQPVPVLRIMPNTPINVGSGATALCVRESPDELTLKCVDDTQQLLKAGGTCEIVSESMLDVISAVIGSSPAFMYVMIEALADGAVLKGLPRDQAIKFAALAMRGASEMVLKTGKHPAQLKDEVCSPAGSTIAGIHALEKAGIRSSLMNAIEACFNRTKEISEATAKNTKE